MPQAKFFLALALHAVQRAIGSSQKLFDRGAIVGIDGDTDADGDGRLLAVVLYLFADARGCLCGVCFAGFREYQRKFIAAVACGSINRATAVGQGRAEAFDGAATGEVAKAVIDFLQLIEIKKQDSETGVGAARALNFGFQHFDEPTMIRKSSERIRSSQMADLVEKLRVVEQS